MSHAWDKAYDLRDLARPARGRPFGLTSAVPPTGQTDAQRDMVRHNPRDIVWESGLSAEGTRKVLRRGDKLVSGAHVDKGLGREMVGISNCNPFVVRNHKPALCPFRQDAADGAEGSTRHLGKLLTPQP